MTLGSVLTNDVRTKGKLNAVWCLSSRSGGAVYIYYKAEPWIKTVVIQLAGMKNLSYPKGQSTPSTRTKASGGFRELTDPFPT